MVGDRIKWTQTTVKYGVIIAVADTLLTIAVNTDYTVANAAITLNYYSHEASPIGYPTVFNYAPTYTGFSASPTISLCQYSITGRVFIMNYKDTVGTSNATGFTISLPCTMNIMGGSISIATDNGSRFGPASIDPNVGGASVILYKNGALLAWTASGTKGTEQLLIIGFIT